MREEPLPHPRILGRHEPAGQIGGSRRGVRRRLVVKDEVVAGERPDKRKGGQRADESMEKDLGDRRHLPLDRKQPCEKDQIGHHNQDGLIPRRKRLEHEDRRPDTEPEPAWPLHPPIDRDERQRNPETPDQVEVTVAMVHAEKAEGERQRRRHRRQVIACVAPGERVYGGCGQQVREEPHDVVGKNRIAGDGVHRQREQADAEQVLSIRQRVGQREELVRLEQRRDAVEHHVVIPGEHPDERPGVAAVARGAKLREVDDGREHDPAGREIDRAEAGNAGVRSHADHSHFGITDTLLTASASSRASSPAPMARGDTVDENTRRS